MDNITPTRPCTVQGSQAFFHLWVIEDRALLQVDALIHPEEQTRIHAQYAELGIIPPSCHLEKLTETLALVEMPDGSVKKVPATQIRFTDRVPLLWDEEGPGWTCPTCSFTCDDPYYLGAGKFCPNCGQPLRFHMDEKED